MSRNRLRHTHSMQWATVIKSLLIVGTLASLGMSYVLMKNQILRVASDVHGLEGELSSWKKRNSQLELNINRMTSLTVLQRRVGDLGLGMVKIGELNVVAMEHGRSTTSNQYARTSVIPVSYGPANREGRP